MSYRDPWAWKPPEPAPRRFWDGWLRGDCERFRRHLDLDCGPCHSTEHTNYDRPSLKQWGLHQVQRKNKKYTVCCVVGLELINRYGFRPVYDFDHGVLQFMNERFNLGLPPVPRISLGETLETRPEGWIERGTK